MTVTGSKIHKAGGAEPSELELLVAQELSNLAVSLYENVLISIFSNQDKSLFYSINLIDAGVRH